MAEISGPDAVPKFSLLQHVEGKVNAQAPKGCSGHPFHSPRESRRAPSFQKGHPSKWGHLNSILQERIFRGKKKVPIFF